MSSAPIVLLAQEGDFTNFVFNALQRAFTVAAVIIEAPVPKPTLLKRRVQRLGLRTVAGQLLFRGLVVPSLSRASRARIAEICAQHELRGDAVPERWIRRVSSVNSQDARGLLRSLGPAVVVVNGTRIIAKETLAATTAPFVNTHAGITPLYRGVHGGYWAMAQGDRAHCGVTVHLVDTGIDTGGILGQTTISPTLADNFVTYPYLQYGAAIPLLLESVHALLAGEATTRRAPEGASKLWSHPTFGEYVRNRLRVGAR